VPGHRILLIEDSPADARLVLEALDETGITATLDVCNTARAALATLEDERATPASLPDLVLLDLNLPDIPGLQVLAQLKADPALCHLPVVVLTTSSADRDISRAYALHANSYIVKPVGFPAFVDAVHAINAFWLGIATRAQR
jgi:chemotaxis family two-component system response regulator Rcp1